MTNLNITELATEACLWRASTASWCSESQLLDESYFHIISHVTNRIRAFRKPKKKMVSFYINLAICVALSSDPAIQYSQMSELPLYIQY